jgi:hypothetical protein
VGLFTCRPYEKQLRRMGLRPRAKEQEPHIVKFLVETFCIDEEP